MIRTGRTLFLGCLLSLPGWAQAEGNSLLIPATSRCALNAVADALPAALQACERAAASGDLQAAYELGEFHYNGQRAPRDLEQARHWYEQASLGGHARAQHQLGLMFFRGEGIPANRVQAYVILKMAAVNGEEPALDSADRVSEQMRGDEREVAVQVLGDIFRDYLLTLQPLDEPR